MNLPIIQSILFGALRPGLASEKGIPTNRDKRRLESRLNSLPDNLTAIEELCKEALSDYVQFDFESERPFCLEKIAPDSYKEIPDYIFPANIEMDIPEPSNPKVKFYFSIIHAEMVRTKLALLDYARVSKSDIDARAAVKDTLKQMHSYALEAAHDEKNEVLEAVVKYLIKTYFEIEITFRPILSGDDSVGFDNFYYECYGNYPDDELKRNFQEADIIVEVQWSYFNNSITSDLVLRLETLAVGKGMRNFILMMIHTAIDNYLFLEILHDPMQPFIYMINQEYVNSIVRQLKTMYCIHCEQKTLAIDRANFIDKICADLSMTTPCTKVNPLSIKDNLFAFLSEQKKAYLDHPNKTYEVVESDESSGNKVSESELPDKETYEEEIASSKYEIFVKEVARYRFTELDAVKDLNEKQKAKLIRLIIGKPVSYAVAMLIHIGYFERLLTDFGCAKSRVFEHVAKAISTSARTVRGNYNASNSYSKEDTDKYPSSKYLNKAAEDYKELSSVKD